MTQKIYISGPMTGYPEYNYPAFNAAENYLQIFGYDKIENPAKNPKQQCWEDYMKVALAQMLTCDTVVILPGWDKSKGAREEIRIANLLKMPVITLETALKRGHKANDNEKEVSNEKR